MSKDRDRENKSGRYVSDEDATRRPDETTSEKVKAHPLEKLLKKLKQGGVISYTCDPDRPNESFKVGRDTFFYIPAAKVIYDEGEV